MLFGKEQAMSNPVWICPIYGERDVVPGEDYCKKTQKNSEA